MRVIVSIVGHLLDDGPDVKQAGVLTVLHDVLRFASKVNSTGVPRRGTNTSFSRIDRLVLPVV